MKASRALRERKDGEGMNVVEKIDLLRKERGWSVNNLAMEAMLTQSTLNNLYSRNTEPKLSTLRAICSAFGITLAEFFADEKEKDGLERTELERELSERAKELSDAQLKALLALVQTM